MKIRLVVSLTVVLAVSSVASAQPRPPLTEELSRLAAELAELRERATLVPTLAATVTELEARMVALEQRLDTLERERASIPDAVAELDRLEALTAALEQEVGALRAELAALEQPWTEEPGGRRVVGGIGFDDGILLATDSPDIWLRIGGFVQTRYRLQTNEDLDEVVVSTLEVPRARLRLAAQASEAIAVGVLIDFARPIALLDFFGDYRVSEALTLRAGQYRTQFTRSFITPISLHAFAERPALIDAYRYGRDPQIGAFGWLGERFGYYVGLGNGAGGVNDNIDPTLLARVELAVLGERMAPEYGDRRGGGPRLTVAAGAVHDLLRVPAVIGDVDVNTDVDADGDGDDVRVVSASADVLFRWRGWELAAEGLFRQERWGTILTGNPELAAVLGSSDEVQHRVAGYAHVLAFALPGRLAVGARVGYGELPLLRLGGQPSSSAPSDRLWQVDGLVMLYNQRGRLLGATYTLFNYDAGEVSPPAQDKTHRLLIETQLAF